MTLPAPKVTAWAFGEVLTSAQMNSIRDSIPKAIDGDAGGSYDPTAPLNIISTSNGEGIGTADITDALNLKSGCTQTVESGGAVVVEAGGSLTLEGATGLPQLGTRSYVYSQPLIPLFNGDSSASSLTNFELSATNSSPNVWVRHGNSFSSPQTSQLSCFFDITNYPHLGTLTGLTIWVDPQPGRTALPTSLPEISLAKMVFSTGALSTPGIQVDTSASLGAYETYHSIALTGLSEVFDGTSRYLARFDSEADADAADTLATFRVFGVTATFQVTQIAP